MQLHTPSCLQHVITGEYLTAGGDLTRDPARALQFETPVDAVRFRTTKGLQWARIHTPVAPMPGLMEALLERIRCKVIDGRAGG